MRTFLISALSLGLGLAAVSGDAAAQIKDVPIVTNADGSAVKSNAGVNPTANGGGGTIVYGDINTGPGTTVIGPPSITTGPAPAPIDTDPAPAPDAVVEPSGETAVSAPAPSEGADATATDLDADNYPDELEWDLGLDPNNADSDSDGAADGDELNIYGTDPTAFDSDGDGVSDGEELFGSQTDPLVWDDFSAGSGDESVDLSQTAVDPSAAPASAVTPTEFAQDASENLTATDGNASAVGAGNASAAPGTVTRDGSSVPSILGPDGRYNVSDTAPPTISVSGDTNVIAPPADASPAANIAGCGSYGTWYDAQLAYESAGLLNADPAIISTLDPDYDGIACEEGM